MRRGAKNVHFRLFNKYNKLLLVRSLSERFIINPTLFGKKRCQNKRKTLTSSLRGSKTSADYGVESHLSQILHEEDCKNEGSNSHRDIASLATKL